MRTPLDTDTLERLLARCQRGDADAWSGLIEQTSDLVWSVARRQGMNEDDAGDVFQGTFLALHGSLANIRSGQALPKWLAVTAVRECHRARRRSARLAGGDPEPVLNRMAGHEPSAEDATQAEVDGFLTRRGLVELGGKCQKLLELLYFQEEADYQEVSRSLGMPIGSIGPTRTRCLAKLKKILLEKGFLGGDVSTQEVDASGVM